MGRQSAVRPGSTILPSALPTASLTSICSRPIWMDKEGSLRPRGTWLQVDFPPAHTGNPSGWHPTDCADSLTGWACHSEQCDEQDSRDMVPL